MTMTPITMTPARCSRCAYPLHDHQTCSLCTVALCCACRLTDLHLETKQVERRVVRRVAVRGEGDVGLNRQRRLLRWLMRMR
jgi:hypothetical protein